LKRWGHVLVVGRSRFDCVNVFAERRLGSILRLLATHPVRELLFERLGGRIIQSKPHIVSAVLVLHAPAERGKRGTG
jgi:hypothetical protein